MFASEESNMSITGYYVKGKGAIIHAFRELCLLHVVKEREKVVQQIFTALVLKEYGDP